LQSYAAVFAVFRDERSMLDYVARRNPITPEK